MKKNLYYIIFVTICFIVQQTHAAPAYPGVINYRLPDGTEISIFLHGDEHINWKSSLDGFTILSNRDGFLEYAVRDENTGDLKLSGVRVHNISERTPEEVSFLSQQPTGLKFSAVQVEILHDLRRTKEDATSAWRGEEEPRLSLPPTVRVPVILVAFQDRPFTRTRADFEMLLDQLNNTSGGLTGSLRDYFLDNSFGQLDVRFDVFGPFTLPGPIIQFTNNTVTAGGTERCGGDSRNMARFAIDAANINGANWALYSVDGRHVNTVHIIYAGHGTEAGAPRCGSIWAHAWSFSPAREHQGFLIDRFSASPELRGSSGNNITHIGVIAHELGHSLLDIRDFYDTHPNNYGGRAVDLGAWCIMASGNWNDGGRTPANFSAWARVHAGWAPEITLSSPANITLAAPYQVAGNVVYRINTTIPNEYFLIENRQRVGWDAFIPGSGMLIYRVDMNHPGWATIGTNQNRVNAFPDNRGYYILQAGCNLPNGCTGNRGTDPWPQSGRTQFTDNTTPSSRSKAGENTNKPITDIVHNTSNRTVSFRFMGGATSPTITTADLPSGRIDVEYNEALSATGENPIIWSIVDGSLPEGLFLSEAGVISGTPTTEETVEFEVKAINSYGEMTRTFSIEINPAPEPPTITTTALERGIIGVPYSDTLLAIGDSVITWGLISGTLPRGLTLFHSGVISGTPNQITENTFTVRASNEVGYQGREFTITITAEQTNIQLNNVEEKESLQAWIATDNSLHIRGLEVGQPYSIYNIMGVLLYQGTVTTDVVRVDAHAFRRANQHSVYIIQSGRYSVRVVW